MNFVVIMKFVGLLKFMITAKFMITGVGESPGGAIRVIIRLGCDGIA